MLDVFVGGRERGLFLLLVVGLRARWMGLSIDMRKNETERTRPMNAANSVFSPNASTNRSHNGAPSLPCNA